MVALRTEPFKKITINNNRDTIWQTSYFRHWGAIGDHYYAITFLTPLWRKLRDQGQRIVYVADVYTPRYSSDPLFELIMANGLVDEVWEHDRNRGGPGLIPPEFVDIAAGKDSTSCIYTPGLYYDQWLTGPGMRPIPIDMLRREMRMRPKFLVPIAEREELEDCYPMLPERYVTIQPYSIGKRKKHVMPAEVIWELNAREVPMVVLRFQTDSIMAAVLFEKLNGLSNLQFIDVQGPLDSMLILAHACCHLGVESSQIIGAGINDVKCYYYEYAPNGIAGMKSDLALEHLWIPVKFSDTTDRVASLVANEYYSGYHGF